MRMKEGKGHTFALLHGQKLKHLLLQPSLSLPTLLAVEFVVVVARADVSVREDLGLFVGVTRARQIDAALARGKNRPVEGDLAVACIDKRESLVSEGDPSRVDDAHQERAKGKERTLPDAHCNLANAPPEPEPSTCVESLPLNPHVRPPPLVPLEVRQRQDEPAVPERLEQDRVHGRMCCRKQAGRDDEREELEERDSETL